MYRRLLLLPVLTAGLAACTDARTPTAPDRSETISADLTTMGDIVPDRYIIEFRPGAADPPGLARRMMDAAGGTLHFTYQSAVTGFAATLPASALDGLRRNPNILSIEADQYLYGIGAGSQTGATWGIDRIDQRGLPLDGNYTWDTSGSGVRLYIIDGGIRPSHAEFAGRASIGADFVGDGQNGIDCRGHGTHVAGTAAGSTYGVAKDAQLIAVRVLNCFGSGTTSGVIAGVDWVKANRVGDAVANMSLGGGRSNVLDKAVRNAISSGITFVVAAGNNNSNACSFSPARVGQAITVGATTNNDTRAGYSNWGDCVDLFAPGSAITSAWYTADNATNTMNGTSMAAPHVAGVAALYLEAIPGADPAEVGAAILNATTRGVVASANSVNNHLLYSFVNGGGGNQPPVASFTRSCSLLACTFTDESTDWDGNVVDWLWDFGDQSTATQQNPQHTYALDGTYTVRLTVTDDAGATGNQEQTFTVSAAGSPITLSASGRKVKGRLWVDLLWAGATTPWVEIRRNGTHLTSVMNLGYFTDNTLLKGSDIQLSYQVCEINGAFCSDVVTQVY